MIEQVHGRFINEEDFPDSKANGYRTLIDAYISYKYEPLVEEYDELKFFTYKYNHNLARLCQPLTGRRKIT